MASKPKVKIIYRNRPAPRVLPPQELNVTGQVNLGAAVSKIASKSRDWMQLWVFVAFFGGAIWAVVLPMANAQAEEFMKTKLADMGMDPANIQSLNENFKTLNSERQELKTQVQDLQGIVGQTKSSIDALQQQNKLILDILISKQQQIAPAAPAQ